MTSRSQPRTSRSLKGDGWRRIVLALLLVPYAVLWAGGITQHMLGGALPSERNWIASLFLLLAGAIALVTTRARADQLRLLAVALIGFAVEVCGVLYGLPFGRYSYTEVLQPQLFGVPLVMALAWMVLVAYIKQLQLLFTSLPAWAQVVTGAAWMTAIDLVIDPLAANGLNYWRWSNVGIYYGIPATNFAGWFVTSLLIFSLVSVKSWRANPWARVLGLSIVLFFTLIALFQHLFLAAFVGLLLCAAQGFGAQSLRRDHRQKGLRASVSSFLRPRRGPTARR